MDRHEMNARLVEAEVASRAADDSTDLWLPSTDLGDLLDRLGCKLIVRDRPLIQYVGWAEQAGLFETIADLGSASVAELTERTCLNESGADALLGVMRSIGLVREDPQGTYTLTEPAREYLVRGSPYFIGDSLYAPRGRIPRPYTDRRKRLLTQLATRLVLTLLPTLRFGSKKRLANQHIRNLSAGVAAVRTGEFAGIRCLLDLAGGSGSFAIPLALAHPDMRIVLAELPQALKNLRRRLASQKLDERIELLGMDMFEMPWRLPACDGIFIGNFLHAFGEHWCKAICAQAFESLSPGGKIWLHEMIWNARRDGPVITALWNATMRLAGGKQRTGSELSEMLREAGFIRTRVVPTAAAFHLIAAEKP
jgi:acetylserotonin N-methyltransferase